MLCGFGNFLLSYRFFCTICFRESGLQQYLTQVGPLKEVEADSWGFRHSLGLCRIELELTWVLSLVGSDYTAGDNVYGDLIESSLQKLWRRLLLFGSQPKPLSVTGLACLVPLYK